MSSFDYHMRVNFLTPLPSYFLFFGCRTKIQSETQNLPKMSINAFFVPKYYAVTFCFPFPGIVTCPIGIVCQLFSSGGTLLHSRLIINTNSTASQTYYSINRDIIYYEVFDGNVKLCRT